MTIQKYRHEDGHGAYLKDPDGEVVFVEDHEAEVARLQSTLARVRAVCAARPDDDDPEFRILDDVEAALAAAPAPAPAATVAIKAKRRIRRDTGRDV